MVRFKSVCAGNLLQTDSTCSLRLLYRAFLSVRQNMTVIRAVALITAIAALYLSSPVVAFVGAGGALNNHNVNAFGLGKSTATHVRVPHSLKPSVVSREGVRSLRASAEEEGEGGFPNPYNAFRKWQMNLVSRARAVWGRSRSQEDQRYSGHVVFMFFTCTDRVPCMCQAVFTVAGCAVDGNETT